MSDTPFMRLFDTFAGTVQGLAQAGLEASASRRRSSGGPAEPEGCTPCQAKAAVREVRAQIAGKPAKPIAAPRKGKLAGT